MSLFSYQFYLDIFSIFLLHFNCLVPHCLYRLFSPSSFSFWLCRHLPWLCHLNSLTSSSYRLFPSFLSISSPSFALSSPSSLLVVIFSPPLTRIQSVQRRRRCDFLSVASPAPGLSSIDVSYPWPVFRWIFFLTGVVVMSSGCHGRHGHGSIASPAFAGVSRHVGMRRSPGVGVPALQGQRTARCAWLWCHFLSSVWSTKLFFLSFSLVSSVSIREACDTGEYTPWVLHFSGTDH